MSLDQVADAGCEYFLNHATIDMDELALTLAVSRATLYRVVNSRDRLLGEVLWRLGERGMARACTTRTSAGIDGVLEVVRVFSAELIDSAPFQRFLAAEPEAAARVLFTPAGQVHRRAVTKVKELFVEARPSTGAWLVGDLDNLAFLLVRIVESMYLTEMLAGHPPDRELAERTARALLTEACIPRTRWVTRAVEAASCLIWTTLPAILCDGRLTLAVLSGD